MQEKEEEWREEVAAALGAKEEEIKKRIELQARFMALQEGSGGEMELLSRVADNLQITNVKLKQTIEDQGVSLKLLERRLEESKSREKNVTEKAALASQRASVAQMVAPLRLWRVGSLQIYYHVWKMLVFSLHVARSPKGVGKEENLVKIPNPNPNPNPNLEGGASRQDFESREGIRGA